MTDNEIIKALECCSTATCISNNCPYEKIHDIPTCTTKLTRDAFDLINRQKAEIERLKYLLDCEEKKYDLCAKRFFKEGVKEFADRLKENSIATFSWNGVVLVEEIDNLLKEMVGDNDE